MTTFTDLGDVQEIDIAGRWTRQSVGIKYDGKRRVLAEFLRADIQLSFYHAEEPLAVASAASAHIWKTFSATKSQQYSGRELLPSELRRMSPVLHERLNRVEFVLLSARLRLISSRIVLQVMGCDVESASEISAMIVPQRRSDRWVIQEYGFRLPRDWHARGKVPQFRGYMALIDEAQSSIKWNTDLPPLYVPSKIRVSI